MPRRPRVLVVLSALSLALPSCDAFTASEDTTQVYALVSVAGTSLQSEPDLWALCSPAYSAEGAEWVMLSDTIVLHPDGSGEERNLARFRYSVPERATRPDTAFLSPNQSSFRWRIAARPGRWRLEFTFGDETNSVPILSDGALEYGDPCAIWRFERVRGNAP